METKYFFSSLLLASFSFVQAAQPAKPNILFIILPMPLDVRQSVLSTGIKNNRGFCISLLMPFIRQWMLLMTVWQSYQTLRTSKDALTIAMQIRIPEKNNR